MTAKPAKQPKSNSQDTQAVGIIMTILGKHDRVVPDIKTVDKYPNIDGHVQIKDDEDYPIGTIAISVKPLNVTLAQAMGVLSPAYPIFIGDTFTPYNYGGLLNKI